MLNELEIKDYMKYKGILFDKMNNLRLENGLFWASPSVDYKASWWRDNCFINMAYLDNYPEMFKQTIQKMLDVIYKMEIKYSKLSSFIRNPEDRECYRFLHAKFNPITEDEIENLGNNWNHNQTDNPALILLNVCSGLEKGLDILDTEDRVKVVQLLIKYLECICDKPNCSSWEEENEIRLSSTALSLKAFLEIKKYGFDVSSQSIEKCRILYDSLFPYEHHNKKNDLMLLYLPYFNISNEIETKTILYNIEKSLLRSNGVCRYKDDEYYKIFNIDAPWTFGLSFLSIAYNKVGFNDISKMYCDKVIHLCSDGNIPELWEAGEIANKNTPLTWALSMQVQAIDNILSSK